VIRLLCLELAPAGKQFGPATRPPASSISGVNNRGEAPRGGPVFLVYRA
jgi:hypothetical protein